MNNNLLQSIKVLALALVIGLGAGTVSAWSPPSAGPLKNNPDKPILESTDFQSKGGPAFLTSLLDVAGQLLSDHLVIAGNSQFDGTVTQQKLADSARTNPQSICADDTGKLIMCP